MAKFQAFRSHVTWSRFTGAFPYLVSIQYSGQHQWGGPAGLCDTDTHVLLKDMLVVQLQLSIQDADARSQSFMLAPHHRHQWLYNEINSDGDLRTADVLAFDSVQHGFGSYTASRCKVDFAPRTQGTRDWVVSMKIPVSSARVLFPIPLQQDRCCGERASAKRRTGRAHFCSVDACRWKDSGICHP